MNITANEFSIPLPDNLDENGFVSNCYNQMLSRFHSFIDGRDDFPTSILFFIGKNFIQGALASLHPDLDLKVFSTVLKEIESFCLPRFLLLIERSTFLSLKQTKEETFNDFLQRIVIYSKKCEFGRDEEELQKVCFASGIQSDSLRNSLTKPTNKDFRDAFICSISSESQHEKGMHASENNVSSTSAMSLSDEPMVPEIHHTHQGWPASPNRLTQDTKAKSRRGRKKASQRAVTKSSSATIMRKRQNAFKETSQEIDQSISEDNDCEEDNIDYFDDINDADYEPQPRPKSTRGRGRPPLNNTRRTNKRLTKVTRKKSSETIMRPSEHDKDAQEIVQYVIDDKENEEDRIGGLGDRNGKTFKVKSKRGRKKKTCTDNVGTNKFKSQVADSCNFLGADNFSGSDLKSNESGHDKTSQEIFHNTCTTEDRGENEEECIGGDDNSCAVEFASTEISRDASIAVKKRNALKTTKPKSSAKRPKVARFGPKKQKRECKKPEKKIYTCNECSETFINRYQYKKHMINTHWGGPQYMCDECGACFPELHRLQSHQFLHTGLRPYKCVTCQKCFKTQKGLTSHSYSHDKEPCRACEICGRSFRTLSGFSSHKITHTGVKRFTCSICGYQSYYRGDLKKHSVIHTNVFPYECETCGKKFQRNTTYRCHQKVHTQKISYFCKVCGKGFVHHSTYKKHLKRHTENQALNQRSSWSSTAASENTKSLPIVEELSDSYRMFNNPLDLRMTADLTDVQEIDSAVQGIL